MLSTDKIKKILGEVNLDWCNELVLVGKHNILSRSPWTIQCSLLAELLYRVEQLTNTVDGLTENTKQRNNGSGTSANGGDYAPK